MNIWNKSRMLDTDVGGSLSLYTRRETSLVADGNLINKLWKETEP